MKKLTGLQKSEIKVKKEILNRVIKKSEMN